MRAPGPTDVLRNVLQVPCRRLYPWTDVDVARNGGSLPRSATSAFFCASEWQVAGFIREQHTRGQSATGLHIVTMGAQRFRCALPQSKFVVALHQLTADALVC